MPKFDLQSLSMMAAGLFFLFLFAKRFLFFKEEEIGASIIGFNVNNAKDECRLSYEHDHGYGQIVMDVSKLEEFTKHKPLEKNCIINYEKSTFLGQKLKSVKVKPKSSNSHISIYFD